MKPFVRFTVTCLFVTAVIFRLLILPTQADEPDGGPQPQANIVTNEVAANRPWEDEHVPASGLRVHNRGRVETEDDWTEPSPRLIGRTRIEPFRDVHQKFVNAFRPSYGLAGTGNHVFRWEFPNDFEVESLSGRSSTWYLIERRSGLWITETSQFTGEQIEPVMTGFALRPPRFAKPKIPLKETQSLRADTARTKSSANSILDETSLNFSGERVTRSEWKLDRVRLIQRVTESSGNQRSPHPQITTFLSNQPTDRLNGFEQESLDRLNTGFEESVFVQEDTKEIQAVGALWCARGCTECHQRLNEGELICGISYRLSRVVNRDRIHSPHDDNTNVSAISKSTTLPKQLQHLSVGIHR